MSVSLLPAIPERGAAVAAEQLIAIERELIRVIPFIDEIPVLEEGRSRARALEGYLRDKDLQRPMLGAQRRIEARIGQLMPPPKPGERTDLQPPDHDPEVRRIERHNDGAEAGDFRLLARALDGECELEPDEWRKSRRALVMLVRQRLDEMPKSPPLPDDQFRCIVADPPWKLDTGPDTFGGTGESGHDALAYAQMSVDQIKALEVQKRTPDDVEDDGAHLYLWTTNRYLERAYGVARAWGFKPSVVLVWAKEPRGVGLGDTFRLTTEFVLFCRRGKLDHRRIVPTTWFNWPRGRHSEKPAEFYSLVESVTPGPYLEMFARKKRDGWIAWGDEIA